MKIYSNKVASLNATDTKLAIDLSKLPDDILLIIATFLIKKDKRNFKNINKFVSTYYHSYLDISDSIVIACHRNNIQIIKQYFEVKETQKRTIVRMITYRLTAWLFTIFWTWMWTGDIAKSTGFATLLHLLLSIDYYIHERIWLKIKWGIK